jgi:RimJ/RimL family protein N-acetyltransferase
MQFDFHENYILENDRVLLRPLTVEDAAHLLPISLNEPETWDYSLLSAGGESGLSAYFQFAVEGRQSQKEYPFIVYDKAAAEFAGSSRFYDINLDYQTLKLGYTWYGKKFRNTKLNKHCKILLLSFAFEAMNMERVEFRADVLNTRSIAAMKSIGCREEGILRADMPTREPGIRRDSIVLSILKNEWFDSVKFHLQTQLNS